MTKLSCGPLWKENNKWENVGLCYILSMTSPCSQLRVRRGVEPPLCCADCIVGRVTRGLRGAGNPTLWGLGQHPGKFWFWTIY